MPSFSCPNCKKVLKTATSIPAGKKIKCPACAQLFAMPAAEEQTAVQAKKPALAPPKPAVTASAEQRPKPSRPATRDEEETPRRSSRKGKARGDDERAGDEDEERPRKKKKK